MVLVSIIQQIKGDNGDGTDFEMGPVQPGSERSEWTSRSDQVLLSNDFNHHLVAPEFPSRFLSPVQSLSFKIPETGNECCISHADFEISFKFSN